MVRPIAILGVGPAGLMAAHACALQGKMVALFSRGDADGKPLKSKLGGAQFLHHPLPGINNEKEPDATIQYLLYGSPDLYKRKVYGDDPNIPFVSMEFLKNKQVQHAWNLQATYDLLWEQLVQGTTVNVEMIGPQWMDKALESQWFDKILSTIPAPVLCRRMAGFDDGVHHFMSRRVGISPGCILSHEIPDNTIVYEGTNERSWYRCSKLFGHGGTEWPGGVRPPYAEVVTVQKPIRTSCDCYKNEIIRLGRHGTWAKGVLTHHAFVGAWDALQ